MSDISRDKIRILIVDDHITVLEGLASIINRQTDMAVVAKGQDGGEAIDFWHKHRPDIILLDLRMPVTNGIDVIAHILQEDPKARAIVLTTFDSDNELASAIKAGAKGYLLKDAEIGELLDCIRKVHRGGTCIQHSLIEKLAQGIHGIPLSGREKEVLQLLARGKSNKDIGSQLFISETTVKSHLRNIFSKLDVANRTEAIMEANRRGLIHL
ncbi:response regulator transcription factor [Microbulbifer bruguierae]|uniref:Response regulator transcription factor n=1 Tax=Microbulbifer bruguierae TaxID=3029061 RepID=A0ABY8NF83_9GAMM|nr:response regulator transcription factor [Microbulbifer bruguierae]WGL17090.1 response regulator transcription factor [Microbulbifer bruguierae]